MKVKMSYYVLEEKEIEIDTQIGIDWQFITTLDGLPVAEM